MPIHAQTFAPPVQILRLPQVCKAAGFGRSLIYQLESERRLPTRVRLYRAKTPFFGHLPEISVPRAFRRVRLKEYAAVRKSTSRRSFLTANIPRIRAVARHRTGVDFHTRKDSTSKPPRDVLGGADRGAAGFS